MKTIILTIILLTAVTFSPAQLLLKPKTECGTIVTDAQKRVELERAARGYDFLAPQLNRPYQIPMTIHIVNRTNGTGGFTLANLEAAMQDLNRLWLPIGIQFYRRGEVDYINSDLLYNLPDQDFWRDVLRQTNPVANTVNVWFTNLAGLCGQASFTSSSPQGILMDNGCAGVGNSPSTYAHEVGHYFDLYHTHETAFGTECPNGSNCSTTGDLFCDTPADPELNFETNVNASCAWTGSAAFPMGCGMTAYNPPTRNIMSYSRRVCRDAFTGNQNSKALNILTTAANRVNLINTLTKYVAADGGLNANCTYQTPCRTLARAVQVANASDTIFVLSGSYPGAVSPQNKAVTVRKWNTDAGVVSVGQ